MGRKRAGTVKVVLTLRLNPETQGEILDLLANSVNQARTVTEGLMALLYGADARNLTSGAEDGSRAAVESLLASWDF